jgi:hypothetical protein
MHANLEGERERCQKDVTVKAVPSLPTTPMILASADAPRRVPTCELLGPDLDGTSVSLRAPVFGALLRARVGPEMVGHFAARSDTMMRDTGGLRDIEQR